MPEESHCPFPDNRPDEREIWTMLVSRDSAAFIACDWGQVTDDFAAEGFHGLDCGRSDDPGLWTLRFPSLEAYRDEWIAQARANAAIADPALALRALLNATTLDRIEIDGDFALAHKKFAGFIPNRDGTRQELLWRTIYIVRRISGTWKIASFVGYLPHHHHAGRALYQASQMQHRTAGPYSPAMGVRGGANIIVLSGQAPLDEEGRVIGDTIECQSHCVMKNCASQLAAAGLGFGDVFKATVYMTDLRHWAAFNEIYQTYMSRPYPARTAIETGLLPGMLVEVEMWAACR